MRTALINENSDLILEYPNYIAQITSGSSELEFLDDFTDPHESMPVIAVTSRLMSTGVNTQTVKLVVLDRTVNSMTEFKQIIGRGTRVRGDCGKLFFTIMDFRKNYVKFADPAFDGEPVKIKDVGEYDNFNDDDSSSSNNSIGKGNPNANSTDDGDDQRGGDKQRGYSHKKLEVHGVIVRVVNEAVEYLDANGNLITKSIIDYSRNNFLKVFPYFEEFQKAWLAQRKKQDLLTRLTRDGVFIDHVRETFLTGHLDDYDVLSYIGYEIAPLTKEERIERILTSGYLEQFSKENQDIIKLLLEVYKEHDVDELVNMRILSMPEFVQKGAPPKIVKGFGGKAKYEEMLAQIERLLYSA